jgi:hypothetical protein
MQDRPPLVEYCCAREGTARIVQIGRAFIADAVAPVNGAGKL